MNAAINNVLESIDAGRKNKATSTNPELIVAEEAVNRALYQLEQAKARISAVESEARVVEQYRDLVEEGTQQFHREMASIMPDVKLREKGSKLSDDELNLFITHAYRKVSGYIDRRTNSLRIQKSQIDRNSFIFVHKFIYVGARVIYHKTPRKRVYIPPTFLSYRKIGHLPSFPL